VEAVLDERRLAVCHRPFYYIIRSSVELTSDRIAQLLAEVSPYEGTVYEMRDAGVEHALICQYHNGRWHQGWVSVSHEEPF